MINSFNRKISTFISLIILASTLALSQAGAADAKSGATSGTTCAKAGATSIVNNVKFTCIKSGKKLVWNKGVKVVAKSGATCTKAGSSSVVKNVKFTCVKSGKKLVWNKGVKVSAKPTTKQTPLITLTNSAKRALANPDLAIPTYDSGNKISIRKVDTQTLSNFVSAATKEKFIYLGPQPLVEVTSDRSGAVSLITQSGQKVYQATSAIPPWGVSFDFKTTDPQGRFLVATSAVGMMGFGNNEQSSWRLAYKEANGTWQYQSIAGTLHPTNNVKYFDQVSLGAPGTYSIKLEFQWNTTFYGVGINEDPKYLTQPQEVKPLKVMVIGDSWTYPIITDSLPYAPWDGYPLALSWLTGWNVMAAGVPGQGYLRKSSGETYRERVIRDVAPQKPDVVIFTGSPNDHCETCSFSDKQIAIEAGKDIKLLAKAYPHALVILCSPFTASSSESKEMGAVAQSLGIPYIDFAKVNLFTQANNGQHELLDGHPTRAGGAYIATELLKAIAALS